MLEEGQLKIRYEFDESGREKTELCIEEEYCVTWISLKEYLEKEMDQSVHEILRRNVIIATQNYNHRVKAFIKEIITNPSNPMSVEHYSAKLKFQGRGAGHDHGTLWVDMKKMDFMMGTESQCDNPIEYHLQDLSIHFESTECIQLQIVKMSLLVCKKSTALDQCEGIESLTVAQKNLEWFASEKPSMDRETWPELLKQFKFIGLNSYLKKFQSYEQLWGRGCD